MNKQSKQIENQERRPYAYNGLSKEGKLSNKTKNETTQSLGSDSSTESS